MNNDESGDKVNLFLGAVFGKRRMLIIRNNHNKELLVRALREYCRNNGIEFTKLNERDYTTCGIRGEIEFVEMDGITCHQRKKPLYITDNKQMIIIDKLNHDADIEILRAFIYMASLGAYWDNIDNLPKDKLPYGSAYVFIADNDFPLDRFASISSSWHSETSVLDLRDFQTRVKEHMGNYKRTVLGIHENGRFVHNGTEYFMEHILPEDIENENIIDKYRDDFFRYIGTMKKHVYFHHLNSSQAMCANFFYPLIKENELNSVLNVIGIQGSIDNEKEYISFEKESDLEQHCNRKTNFDFYIKLKEEKKLLFEIKYTENEFGKAQEDPEHDRKYLNTYRELLEKNQAIEDCYKEKKPFMYNYQIMRNLVHISSDSYVIFIYPYANTGIRLSAENAKQSIIKSGWRDHFILLTWEELVEQVIQNLNSLQLIDYYKKDFTKKYMIS